MDRLKRVDWMNSGCLILVENFLSGFNNYRSAAISFPSGYIETQKVHAKLLSFNSKHFKVYSFFDVDVPM